MKHEAQPTKRVGNPRIRALLSRPKGCTQARSNMIPSDHRRIQIEGGAREAQGQRNERIAAI